MKHLKQSLKGITVLLALGAFLLLSMAFALPTFAQHAVTHPRKHEQCHIMSMSHRCGVKTAAPRSASPQSDVNGSGGYGVSQCHIMTASVTCQQPPAILTWKLAGSGVTPWFNTPQSWRLIANCVGSGLVTFHLYDIQRPVATFEMLCGSRQEFQFLLSDRLYLSVQELPQNDLALTVATL